MLSKVIDVYIIVFAWTLETKNYFFFSNERISNGEVYVGLKMCNVSTSMRLKKNHIFLLQKNLVKYYFWYWQKEPFYFTHPIPVKRGHYMLIKNIKRKWLWNENMKKKVCDKCAWNSFKSKKNENHFRNTSITTEVWMLSAGKIILEMR